MWGPILRYLLGELGPLLELILTTLTNRGAMDHLMDLARAEVAKLEGDTTLDGAAKRQAAFDAIVADLKAAGQAIVPVLVNLAIEAALAALRARTGYPLPAPPA